METWRTTHVCCCASCVGAPVATPYNREPGGQHSCTRSGDWRTRQKELVATYQCSFPRLPGWDWPGLWSWRGVVTKLANLQGILRGSRCISLRTTVVSVSAVTEELRTSFLLCRKTFRPALRFHCALAFLSTAVQLRVYQPVPNAWGHASLISPTLSQKPTSTGHSSPSHPPPSVDNRDRTDSFPVSGCPYVQIKGLGS